MKSISWVKEFSKKWVWLLMKINSITNIFQSIDENPFFKLFFRFICIHLLLRSFFCWNHERTFICFWYASRIFEKAYVQRESWSGQTNFFAYWTCQLFQTTDSSLTFLLLFDLQNKSCHLPIANMFQFHFNNFHEY